jgi:hypothetical protein
MAKAKKNAKAKKTGNSQILANLKNIKRNRKAVFNLETAVSSNKSKAYATRSTIEENRALILKNYTAAFMGNRQLANQNTDDIFRNRKSILSNFNTKSEVEVNYVESLTNQASIEYLEHRAELNASVLEVNKMMAEVNAKLIAINSKIMASNQKIVAFNSKNLSENARVLKSGLSASSANPPSNAKRIINNKARLSKISKQSSANAKTIVALHKTASNNRANIEKNSTLIHARRDSIEQNQAKISQNQTKVANLISRN